MIYPFEDVAQIIFCDVHLELLHNSYTGADINQLVYVEFIDTNNLTFSQNEQYDYSEIYQVDGKCEDTKFTIDFFSRNKGEKIKFLTLICKKIIIKEL